jgi:hypothetical protein
MHKAINKMLELGKINPENQKDFVDLFSELPNELRFEEAESLLGIFNDDDYDDYGAFGWNLILLLEKTKGIEKIKSSSKFQRILGGTFSIFTREKT